MSAYTEAKRIFLENYLIFTKCENLLNGPIFFGRRSAKCAFLSGKYPNEVIHIPKYVEKYKYLVVVYCKNKKRSSIKFDDVLVYKTEEIKKISGRSYGTIMFRQMPLALDM